jgi:hypothetical protein
MRYVLQSAVYLSAIEKGVELPGLWNLPAGSL